MSLHDDLYAAFHAQYYGRPERYAAPTGWGGVEPVKSANAKPGNKPKSNPLPLPKLTGVDPEEVQHAWGVVSARYPKIAKGIKEIRRAAEGEMPGSESGENPNAAYSIGGTILVPQGKIQPSHLFHEITHAAQDQRGNLKPRSEMTADEFGATEATAHSRGSAAKPMDQYAASTKQPSFEQLADHPVVETRPVANEIPRVMPWREDKNHGAHLVVDHGGTKRRYLLGSPYQVDQLMKLKKKAGFGSLMNKLAEMHDNGIIDVIDYHTGNSVPSNRQRDSWKRLNVNASEPDRETDPYEESLVMAGQGEEYCASLYSAVHQGYYGGPELYARKSTKSDPKQISLFGDDPKPKKEEPKPEPKKAEPPKEMKPMEDRVVPNVSSAKPTDLFDRKEYLKPKEEPKPSVVKVDKLPEMREIGHKEPVRDESQEVAPKTKGEFGLKTFADSSGIKFHILNHSQIHGVPESHQVIETRHTVRNGVPYRVSIMRNPETKKWYVHIEEGTPESAIVHKKLQTGGGNEAIDTTRRSNEDQATTFAYAPHVIHAMKSVKDKNEIASLAKQMWARAVSSRLGTDRNLFDEEEARVKAKAKAEAEAKAKAEAASKKEKKPEEAKNEPKAAEKKKPAKPRVEDEEGGRDTRLDYVPPAHLPGASPVIGGDRGEPPYREASGRPPVVVHKKTPLPPARPAGRDYDIHRQSAKFADAVVERYGGIQAMHHLDAPGKGGLLGTNNNGLAGPIKPVTMKTFSSDINHPKNPLNNQFQTKLKYGANEDKAEEGFALENKEGKKPARKKSKKKDEKAFEIQWGEPSLQAQWEMENPHLAAPEQEVKRKKKAKKEGKTAELVPWDQINARAKEALAGDRAAMNDVLIWTKPYVWHLAGKYTKPGDSQTRQELVNQYMKGIWYFVDPNAKTDNDKDITTKWNPELSSLSTYIYNQVGNWARSRYFGGKDNLPEIGKQIKSNKNRLEKLSKTLKGLEEKLKFEQKSGKLTEKARKALETKIKKTQDKIDTVRMHAEPKFTAIPTAADGESSMDFSDESKPRGAIDTRFDTGEREGTDDETYVPQTPEEKALAQDIGEQDMLSKAGVRKRERQVRVQEAIDKLPPYQQELLRMHFGLSPRTKPLSLREMAAELSKKENQDLLAIINPEGILESGTKTGFKVSTSTIAERLRPMLSNVYFNLDEELKKLHTPTGVASQAPRRLKVESPEQRNQRLERNKQLKAQGLPTEKAKGKFTSLRKSDLDTIRYIVQAPARKAREARGLEKEMGPTEELLTTENRIRKDIKDKASRDNANLRLRQQGKEEIPEDSVTSAPILSKRKKVKPVQWESSPLGKLMESRKEEKRGEETADEIYAKIKAKRDRIQKAISTLPEHQQAILRMHLGTSPGKGPLSAREMAYELSKPENKKILLASIDPTMQGGHHEHINAAVRNAYLGLDSAMAEGGSQASAQKGKMTNLQKGDLGMVRDIIQQEKDVPPATKYPKWVPQDYEPDVQADLRSARTAPFYTSPEGRAMSGREQKPVIRPEDVKRPQYNTDPNLRDPEARSLRYGLATDVEGISVDTGMFDETDTAGNSTSKKGPPPIGARDKFTLAQGFTSDPSLVEYYRKRAAKKNYHFYARQEPDPKTGKPSYRIKIALPKGTQMKKPTEFFRQKGKPERYASPMPSFIPGSVASIGNAARTVAGKAKEKLSPSKQPTILPAPSRAEGMSVNPDLPDKPMPQASKKLIQANRVTYPTRTTMTSQDVWRALNSRPQGAEYTRQMAEAIRRGYAEKGPRSGRGASKSPLSSEHQKMEDEARRIGAENKLLAAKRKNEELKNPPEKTHRRGKQEPDRPVEQERKNLGSGQPQGQQQDQGQPSASPQNAEQFPFVTRHKKGMPTKIHGEGIEPIDGYYALADLFDLVPSHIVNEQGVLVPNPKRKVKGDQPRSYEKETENARKVQRYADEKVGAYFVTDNPDPTTGPMTVDEEGHVSNGSGRHAVAQEAARRGEYDWIAKAVREKAKDYKIEGWDDPTIKYPILVRVHPGLKAGTPEFQEFARAGNEPTTPPEQLIRQAAVMGDRILDKETLDQLADQLKGEATLSQILSNKNHPLVEKIRKELNGRSAYNHYFNKDELHENGRNLVEDMLLSRFVSVDDLEKNSATRSLKNSIGTAIPHLIRIGSQIKDPLTKAFNFIVDHPDIRSDRHLKDYLGQGSLFDKGNDVEHTTALLLDEIYKAKTDNGQFSGKAIRSLFHEIAKAAAERRSAEAGETLFGKPSTSWMEDVMHAVKQARKRNEKARKEAEEAKAEAARKKDQNAKALFSARHHLGTHEMYSAFHQSYYGRMATLVRGVQKKVHQVS